MPTENAHWCLQAGSQRSGGSAPSPTQHTQLNAIFSLSAGKTGILVALVAVASCLVKTKSITLLNVALALSDSD